jgi:hypothetical protein
MQTIGVISTIILFACGTLRTWVLVGLLGDLAEPGCEATRGLRYLSASPRAPVQVLSLSAGLDGQRYRVLLGDAGQGASGDGTHSDELVTDLSVAAPGAAAGALGNVVQNAASRDRIARQPDFSGSLVELVAVRALAVGLPAFAGPVAPVEPSLVRSVEHSTRGLTLLVQEHGHIVRPLFGERSLVVREHPAKLDLLDGRPRDFDDLDRLLRDRVVVAGEARDADHLGAQHPLGLGQRELLGLVLATEDVQAGTRVPTFLVLGGLFSHDGLHV